MSAAGASLRRMYWLAGHTVRTAVRQRVVHFVVWLAVGLVLAVQGLREFNFGASELKFMADFGFGAMAFFGSVLAVTLTVQTFFREFEQRTVATLLAKPVRRGEWIVAQWCGVAAILLGLCALLTALLAAVLWSRSLTLVPGGAAPVNYGALLAVAWAHVLKLFLLGALTLLLATLASTALLAQALGFSALVICHLQYLAQLAAERADSWLARAGAGLLAVVVPNFQVFNVAETLEAGRAVSAGELGRLTAYAAAYVLAVLALAARSFHHREL